MSVNPATQKERHASAAPMSEAPAQIPDATLPGTAVILQQLANPSGTADLTGRVRPLNTSFDKDRIFEIARITVPTNRCESREGKLYYVNVDRLVEIDSLFNAVCDCTAQIPPQHITEELVKLITDLMQCGCSPIRDAWAQIIKTIKLAPLDERAELIQVGAPVSMVYTDGFRRDGVLRFLLNMPKQDRREAATHMSRYFHRMHESFMNLFLQKWENTPRESRLNVMRQDCN